MRNRRKKNTRNPSFFFLHLLISLFWLVNGKLDTGLSFRKEFHRSVGWKVAVKELFTRLNKPLFFFYFTTYCNMNRHAHGSNHSYACVSTSTLKYTRSKYSDGFIVSVAWRNSTEFWQKNHHFMIFNLCDYYTLLNKVSEQGRESYWKINIPFEI